MSPPADDQSYLDIPLGRFLDAVAATEPAPSGGAVAAVAVGMAAGLTAMAAGLSATQLTDAAAVAARAEQLRARVAPLAQADAVAYGEVLAALRRPTDDPGRREAVRLALANAAEVPLEIAEAGAAVIELAERVERSGNPNLRGDALTARLLAAGAVRSAAALVELNIPDVTDPRVVRARALAAEALRRGS